MSLTGLFLCLSENEIWEKEKQRKTEIYKLWNCVVGIAFSLMLGPELFFVYHVLLVITSIILDLKPVWRLKFIYEVHKIESITVTTDSSNSNPAPHLYGKHKKGTTRA